MFDLYIRLLPLWLSLTLVQGAIFASHNNDFDEKAWREAGEYLQQYMDFDQEPCENFFDHVCSKLWKSNESRTAAGDISHDVRNQTLALIKENGQHKDGDLSRSEMMAKEFYNRCMTSERGAIETIVKKILQRRANETNLWRLLGFAKRELGLQFGFRFEMKTKPTSQLILNLNRSRIQEINKGIRRLAEERNFTQLEKRIDRFEDEFLDVPPYWQITEITITLAAILETQSNASIDFISYMDEWTTDEATKKRLSAIPIVIVDPIIVYAFGDYLNDVGAEIIFEWLLEVVSNESQSLLRAQSTEEICGESVMERLSPIVARLYLKPIKQDAAELRRDLVGLQSKIISAFNSLLDNVDWMDEREKEKIRKKADDIDFYAGLPDWIGNETRLVEEASYFLWNESASIFESQLNFNKTKWEQDLKAFAHGRDSSEMVKFKFNAAYSPTMNRMINYFGASVAPQYQVQYPLAVKYGSLGAIMGHELMHAFDGNIISLPPPSMQGTEQWLTNGTLKEFEKRKQCFVRQYAHECSRSQMVCLGEHKFSENMADVEGLKVAYAAYKFASQVSGKDPPIPSLKNYTQDQLFFVAYARISCASERSNEGGFGADPHGPERARVDMALKNVPTFAMAYRCPMGSKYAPLKRCDMWGDMEEPAKLLKAKG